MVAPVVVTPLHLTHRLQRESPIFTSDFLPISEEKEDDHSQDSILAGRANERKTKFDFSITSLQQFISAAMLGSQDSGLSRNRRPSDVSTSDSSQYNFEGGASLRTPTLTNISSIANERENMKTPRPNAPLDTSPSSRNNLSSALANHGKDFSDSTLGPNEGGTTSPEYITREAGLASNDYGSKSNSLGRMSISSSGHGNYPSVGDTGDKTTTTTASASSTRKSKRKTIAPPELLVIVRPPPSKQVNPLNLQIQLVIPQVNSNTLASRASMDSSREEQPSMTPSGSSNSTGPNTTLTAPTTPTGSQGLKRSSSMTSSRSTRSEASSGGYSNASSSTSGRRVTPLYNLNFHSITATTVTDAGTDEKVAKFGKKAVEIDGFGHLEPHEYFLGVNDLTTLMQRRQSTRTAMSNTSNSDFTSPDALSEASHHQGTDITKATSRLSDVGVQQNDQEPPTSFDAMSPEAKNPDGTGLGGKLLSRFKRFSIGTGQNLGGKLNSIGTPSIRSGNTTNDAPTSLLAKVTSSVNKLKEGGETVDENSDVLSRTESMMLGGQSTLGQALGIEVPQLIAGGGLRSDGRKTEGYFWTVKKWNRRSTLDYEEDGRDLRLEEAGNNPILNSVWKRFNIVNRMGGQEIHPPCSEVPVRFEWTRNTERRKSSVVSSGHGKAVVDGANRIQSVQRRSFVNRASLDVKNTNADGSLPNTESIDVIRSNLKPPKPGQTSRPSSIYSNSSARPRQSMDAGSQGGSHENGEDSDPEDSETIWSCHLVLGPTTRIPIGSLSPTPHHPKLIGQLSIPFPLPDLSQSGLGADGAGLTREELKDIISITCLFVVIREGFGGLVRRKK